MRKPRTKPDPNPVEEPIALSGPFASAWHAQGDPDADAMVAKARLVSALQDAITTAGLKQVEAAECLGMTPSNLSRLLSGRFRSISFDQLFKLLAAMGLDVRVTLAPAAPGKRGGVALLKSAGERAGG